MALRVVLVNAPASADRASGGKGRSLPPGLFVVADAIRAAGNDVVLIDAVSERMSRAELVQEIAWLTPDVVMTARAGPARVASG
jgi:hypothetical protein